MRTAIDFRANKFYAPNESEEDEAGQTEKSLSVKIETLKESIVHLARELDSLKVIASKIEAFKSIDAVVSGEGADINFHETVRRFEIDLISRALEQTKGHQMRAARILGMNVTTLNSMIKRYNINPLDYAVGQTAGNERSERRHKGMIAPLKETTYERTPLEP